MIIIFWEMTPCGSYKNRHFGGSYRLHLKKTSTSRCLYKSLQLHSVTCSHSCTLKMEAIRSFETSVLVRATRCHLPEDDNHHSHRHGNIKSYNLYFACQWAHTWQHYIIVILCCEFLWRWKICVICQKLKSIQSHQRLILPDEFKC
jgi:hypothetical protein